jgi:Flp pilus assembly pilin Flp
MFNLSSTLFELDVLGNNAICRHDFNLLAGLNRSARGISSLESILRERENTMKTFITNFVQDEQGQDLIEYTLLLAFVALASAAVFLGAGGSIKGIWGTANSQLGNAATFATGS